MSFDSHKNFAITTVSTAPSPGISGTSLIVTDGTVFPVAPFNCTVWPTGVQATRSNAEIVRVTNVATNTLTIQRAQETSTARTIIAGDQIALTVTAKGLTDMEALLVSVSANGLDWTGTISGVVSSELKVFREAITTPVISANTVTFDLTLSNSFKVALTSNITTITVSGWTAAKATPVTFRLTQDATGGRTVVFPAAWRWAGGTAPTQTATANKADIYVLWSDDGGTTIFASQFTVNA